MQNQQTVIPFGTQSKNRKLLREFKFLKSCSLFLKITNVRYNVYHYCNKTPAFSVQN